jgi:hypothetical protein
MIRLLPRTPRGTWLLAGAVSLAGCGVLWWIPPPAPRAEWTVPGHGERSANGHDSSPWVLAVRPDRGAIIAIGSIYLWSGHLRDLDAHLCGPLQILDVATGRERRRYFTAQDTFWAAVASPDIRWLALLRADVYTHDDWSGLVIIDLESDEVITVPDASCRGNSPCHLAFLTDGSAVIYPWTNGQTGGFRVWDLAARRVIGEIRTPNLLWLRPTTAVRWPTSQSRAAGA